MEEKKKGMGMIGLVLNRGGSCRMRGWDEAALSREGKARRHSEEERETEQSEAVNPQSQMICFRSLQQSKFNHTASFP